VPLAAEVCGDISVGSPPAAEVRRHLGYPAEVSPKARIADRIEAVAQVAVGALQPRGVYSVHAVTAQTAHRIEVGGVAIRGEVAGFMGPVERIAIVAATVGDGISELAKTYARNGDSLDAWIADAVGSWAAEAAADAVMERVAARLGPGEAATLRYCPGYCGMAIDQQRVLLGLVDADAAGIVLLPSMLMRPLKSVCGVVGVGPAGRSEEAPTSPCDICDRVGCHMRR
jgi:hypothetical protein